MHPVEIDTAVLEFTGDGNVEARRLQNACDSPVRLLLKVLVAHADVACGRASQDPAVFVLTPPRHRAAAG